MRLITPVAAALALAAGHCRRNAIAPSARDGVG
jgi:hypothetical protein